MPQQNGPVKIVSKTAAVLTPPLSQFLLGPVKPGPRSSRSLKRKYDATRKNRPILCCRVKESGQIKEKLDATRKIRGNLCCRVINRSGLGQFQEEGSGSIADLEGVAGGSCRRELLEGVAGGSCWKDVYSWKKEPGRGRQL